MLNLEQFLPTAPDNYRDENSQLNKPAIKLGKYKGMGKEELSGVINERIQLRLK